MIALIDGLERFCEEIVTNKLFWVNEVLSFFNISAGTPLSTQLLAEHDKYVQSICAPDRRTVDKALRGSYANYEDMIKADDEIEEEKNNEKTK